MRQLLGLLPLLAATAVLATGPQREPYVAPALLSRLSGGEPTVPVLVALRPDAAQLRELSVESFTRPGFRARRLLQSVPVVTGELTLQGLLELSRRPDVAAISADGVVRPSGQVGTAQIGADRMAAVGLTGEGRSVAVVDSGIDLAHPDFETPEGAPAKVRGGISFAGDAADLSDCGGHGTEVAGVVAGPQGIAPGAGLVVLKVFGRSTDCQTAAFSDVLAAIDWAVVNGSRLGIDVVNLSLSDDSAHPRFCDSTDPVGAQVFRAAREAGLAVVAAAGNEGNADGLAWPACLSDVAAIGMVYSASVGPTSWGGAASCLDDLTGPDVVPCASNAGSGLSLLAPGIRWVTPTAGGGRTASFSGTSAAAPAAAGALLLARQARPMADASLAVDLLRATGVPVPDPKADRLFPRIDLSAALDAVTPATGPCVPAEIPDGVSGGTVCEAVVSSVTGSLAGVSVALAINHPDPTQLVVSLVAPDGTRLLLMNRSGSRGRAFREVFGRTVDAIEPLSSLAGRPAAGTWKLQVTDTVPGLAGRVVSWAVLLEPTAPRLPFRQARPSATIPATARSAGRFGSFFLTDLRLFNADPVIPAVVRLYFVPSGQDGREASREVELVLPPLSTRVLDDVLGDAFRTAGAGPIHVEAPSSVVTVSRTRATAPGGGTFGFGLGPTSPSAAAELGEAPLHLLVPAGTGGFRVNVGFVELAGDFAVAELVVRDARGAPRGSLRRDVPPLSSVQANDVYAEIGVVPDPGDRLELRVVDGFGRLTAFATALDNTTNDATAVVAGRASAAQRISATAHAPGAGGTFFRTELKIANPSSTPLRVLVSLQPTVGPDAAPVAVTLGAGRTRVFQDVLPELFGLEGPAAGALRIEALDPGAFVASSRTYTQGAQGGTYGLAVAPAAEENAASPLRRIALAFLGASSAYRTNVGFVETVGVPTRARVSVFDVSGAPLGSAELFLAPFQSVQWNDVFAAMSLRPQPEASALVEVLSGGALTAHAIRIDNSTGDAAFVAGVLVP